MLHRRRRHHQYLLGAVPQQGQSDPSAGSAPARLLRLLRAGLTALGGVHSQRERPAHRAQVTASGACASRLQSRPFPRLVTTQVPRPPRVPLPPAQPAERVGLRPPHLAAAQHHRRRRGTLVRVRVRVRVGVRVGVRVRVRVSIIGAAAAPSSHSLPHRTAPHRRTTRRAHPRRRASCGARCNLDPNPNPNQALFLGSALLLREAGASLLLLFLFQAAPYPYPYTYPYPYPYAYTYT
eukprot:scaffold42898_cov62-Phaeocystis_antarctica.AAC.7